MNTENQPSQEMVDFVKAISDSDRLRIIGVLVQTPAPAKQVAEQLKLPFRDAFNHLVFLSQVGILREQDGVYELDTLGMEKLARNQLLNRRESYTPAPDLDQKTRKVLATYLNPDGTIRQIPQQPAKLKVILDYLITAFTPGANYTEKEVNTLIRRFHLDVSGLRRDLVEAGFLARERDGSRYWRPEKPDAEEGPR
jgi:hypothetical protein